MCLLSIKVPIRKKSGTLFCPPCILRSLVLFDPIDRTLSGANSPVQSGPGSDSNEGLLRIPQSSSITVTSLSDCSVSYPGLLLGRFYPSAEMQSVYSTTPSKFCAYLCILVSINVSVCERKWIYEMFLFFTQCCRMARTMCLPVSQRYKRRRVS